MFKKIDTSFFEAIDRTHNVKSFRFDDLGGIDFRPGQFFQLFLDWEGQELSHYFSFSNSPTERGYLEFTKKLSDSSFSQALQALQPGDPVRIKLPMGQFIFEGQYPKVVFLSGGIGITPIRSICKFLTDTSSSAEAIILYSARTKQDIVFHEDFVEMQKQNEHLSVIYSITDQEPSPEWDGRTGRINSEMMKEEIPDFSGRVFYVCGPPGMVEALTSMLKNELGLPPEKVIFENFTGY
ncbi:MAG: FAD-dependent oxidoreductase [Candidatus Tritonobacter lacicola]|nr:FAD-dependent oxidoreductase [Candidatus Tritonobacter lacicola]